MVHEADALTDLPHKHHAVHLRQLVVIIDDPLKELTALHTAWGQRAGSPGDPYVPLVPRSSPSIEMLV